MSSDSALDNNILSHSSNWHSIRPWTPSLSLAVREVTSVSATFILSSTLSGEFSSSLASLGLEAAEEASENPQDSPSSNGNSLMSMQRKNNSVIADALAKGLSVNVNGSAWQRAFIRIDDQLDEAVIIIYALMPGRQYDIELGLPSAGQTGTIRRQVTTEDDSDQDTTENNTDPESPTGDNSTSSSDPHSTPSTSPSRTVPGTPPAAAPQVTLEDRITQLQHTLSQVNAEQEGLVASLKTARKESQKADAALRSEIDTLKKTSEKNAATELRRNQKLLQLQEAVKQAHKSTEAMEKDELEMKAEFPELKATKDKKEEEYAKVKLAAESARKEREDVEEKERKRLEAMRAELAVLSNKLEKLGVKKEKLEKTVIPDLEEKVEEVSKEIQAQELEIAKLEEEENQIGIQNELPRSMNSEPLFDDIPSSYVPMQRIRQHPSTDKPAPIGRPSPLAPIQRPPLYDVPPSGNNSLGSTHSTSSNPLWSPTLPGRQGHSNTHAHHHGQNQSHSPHSQSFNKGQSHSAPMLPLSIPRRGSLKSNQTNISAPAISTVTNSSSNHSSSLSGSTHTTTSSPTSSSINSSPTRSSPAISAAASTLSSRAPAFEPSRSILNGNSSHFYGNGSGNGNSNAGPTPPGLTKPNAGMSGQRPRETSLGLGNRRPSPSSSGSKNGLHAYSQWTAPHASGSANSSFDNSRS